MANKNLNILIDNETLSIPIGQGNSGAAAIISTFQEDKNKLNTIIDTEAQTINDPGFVDVSQLKSLSFNTDSPGYFPVTARKVTFTAADKANLQTIIKKLADCAHQHSFQVSTIANEGIRQASCSNNRICNDCSYCENCNHCTNHGQ